jgi:hypothetical protein
MDAKHRPTADLSSAGGRVRSADNDLFVLEALNRTTASNSAIEVQEDYTPKRETGQMGSAESSDGRILRTKAGYGTGLEWLAPHQPGVSTLKISPQPHCLLDHCHKVRN